MSETVVLLVEGNLDDAPWIRALLESAGGGDFELISVENADAATVRLGHGGIDVILLDLPLVDRGGIDTIRRILCVAKRVPVVVMTGLDDNDLALSLLREGVADYLVKKPDLLSANLVRTLRYTVEKRRGAAALRESEERFLQLANYLEDVFWIYDLDSRAMIYANPAYEKIWGRSRERLYRDSTEWIDAIHANDRDRVVLSFQERGALGNFSEEYRIVRPDGAERWIADRGYSVRDESGKLRRVVGIARDVTERKRREEALVLSQRLESIGRLAGGVAHDFNNLLTVIIGNAQLLGESLSDGRLERSVEEVEEIERAGQKAAALTTGLLAFGRKQVLETRPVDLNAVVSELSGLLGRLIGEDIQMAVVLEPELGTIVADPTQLEQILTNLVVNARDAMPEGGVLDIQTRNVVLGHGQTIPPMSPGEYVLLTVSDTGMGMDPETRARIFEPYFTTKGDGEGNGLGLATVYGIVKQSGGYIWVESKPGNGCLFQIYFPRVQASVDSPGGEGHSDPAEGGSERILLVEDDDRVRRLAMRILEGQGYDVLDAPNGIEALAAFDKLMPSIDLIITDMVMPRMNGHRLAAALRKSLPTVKVLYISGHAEELVARQGVLEAGSHLLRKPFCAQSLCARVREILDLPLAGLTA